MPAVELLKLRSQISKLSEHISDPDVFHSTLVEILDLYSNRAYRPGTAVKPQPLLASYRVAPLIMRELVLELSNVSREYPEQALQLSNTLWKDSHLEPRKIAAVMLGAIPLEYGEAIIERLRTWSLADENFRILDLLYEDSTTSLRRNGSMLPIRLAEEWITGSQTRHQAIGIRLLIPIVKDQQFENLPPIYRLISPLIQNIPSALQTDIQAILEVLIKRSPAETAFYLRQILPIASGENTARLIRRCLPLFGPDQQANLKSALKAADFT